MDELAIRFLNEEGSPVTQEAVNKLACEIRNHYCGSAWLALDEYGEEDFLAVYMDNDWVSLSFNTWDEDGEAHMYQPVNPAYESSREDAPVRIGGKNPVLKRNALDDLNIAAECVLYFAKTGKLYPELRWEEAEDDLSERSDAGGTAPIVQIELNLNFSDLPTALTDRDYVFGRGEEIRDIASEALELVQTGKYRNAVPLITDIIESHPDRAQLYILRSFCWNKLEAGLGRSRKPDMDRDMTQVVELEPDNIMALRARCPSTGTSSRYRRHIEDLTRLMELDPEYRDIYQVTRAYRYHWLKE